MTRAPRLLLAAAFGLGATAAPAQVIPWFGHLPMVPYPQVSGSGPPPTGAALMASNGASYVFASDGVSHICLSGVTSC